MRPGQHGYILGFVCAVSGLFYSPGSGAAQFEPSIGAGVEYTDNAQKRSSGSKDVITAGYVGARLSENEARLNYLLDANFNDVNYIKDSFDDQQYYNFSGSANWEMVRDRFDWFASNYFQQRPILSINNSNPNNIQDSNVFNFGANIYFPFSARQTFTVIPAYSQYYYAELPTDNKQVGVNAIWDYQWRRRISIGLSFSTRKIDYTEENIFGVAPADTSFANLSFLISGIQRRSSYSINLGSTRVKREGGREGGGFAGSLNWLTDLTSRSEFNLLLSTDITDSSSVAASAINNPINGSPDDVQIATDVIRNSIFSAAYLRNDASLHTRLWWEFRKVKYSDSPLDRTVRTFGVRVDYPVTQLLTSGLDAIYSRTRQLDTERLDDRYTLNGSMRYQLSRKLFTAMDVSYRKKDSNDLPGLQSFDEFAVFVRLVYGPGGLQRPTSIVGF